MKRITSICAVLLMLSMALVSSAFAAEESPVCYPTAISVSDDGTELKKIYDLSPEADREVHAGEAAGNSALVDLFHDLLEAVVARDMLGALETGEAVADLKVREQQKTFCRLASEDLRRIFLLQKMPSLARIPEGEEDFYIRMARSLKPTFPRKGMAALDRSLLLVERNVNQKILFTHLVNQLYTL